MKTPHLHRPNGDPGIVWFVLPMVWAAIGLVGFTLIANWPELFAQDERAASLAATAPANAGADRSMHQPGGTPSAGVLPAPDATDRMDQL